MKLRLALLVSLSALTFAPAAEAKLCVRIAAPRTALAGQVVTVRVTTLLPTWQNGRLVGVQPVGFSGRLLQLELRGPAWDTLRLRRSSRPAVWLAQIVFAHRGVWMLYVAGWESAPRECAPEARVLVR